MYSLSEPFNYENDYNYALNQPISFWDELASKYVHWDKKYESVYSDDNVTNPEWFKGGLLNSCYNALDIHMNDPLKENQIAIICECPYLNQTIKITYKELYERVCQFSRVLLNLNIAKGDVVLIHLPTSIEGAISMLSCARIGAIHAALLDCMSVNNLVDRINYLCPKLIITTNYGILNDKVIPFSIPLLNALELSKEKPNYIISHKRNENIEEYSELISNIPTIPNSLDWDELVSISKSNAYYEYIPVESSHPLYIVYTSGTTGNSKPVVKDNASHLVGSKYYWSCLLKTPKYPITYFSVSSLGWTAFHTHLYSRLSSGDTLVIYEGSVDTPKNVLNDFWSIIERNKVNFLLIPPRLMRLLNKLDPDATLIRKYDYSSLKCIWIGGENVDHNLLNYIENAVKVPVIECYAQTETNAVILSNQMTKTINPKSLKRLCKPLPFLKLSVFNEDGKECCANEIGELVCKLPMPPGFASTFYNNNEKYNQLFTKFKGYYNTGDAALKDEEGNIELVSRIDDIVKVKGFQIELTKVEQSILKHPFILDCCCIGIKSIKTGEDIIGLIVLKENESIMDIKQFENQINSIITKELIPDAIIRGIVLVNKLPKNKSGKLTRGIITNLFNDANYKIPNSYDDFETLNSCYNNYKSTINK